MMVANMANGVSTAQAPPPTMVITAAAPPPLQSPPVLSALQPSPTERLNASSTSPTNTSGSDGSAVSGLDIAAVLAACQKQEFPPAQQDPPIPNPLFTMPDASAILQFFQSQQAAMIQAAAQRAAVVQQQAQQQQEQHQRAQQTTERKRSYPCTFQFCVICQKDVHSSKLPCHIRQCHVAKPMFQCPACDFTSTYSKNNVKSHMVSLHGLAGDPISYMDRYAPQVEEFMRMCFPNVRGRGRPMQGRGSPRSPASPQSVAQRRQSQQNARRASYARDNELLVQAQQQQLQQAQAQAQAALLAQAQSLNQLSIFPQLFNNNNTSLVNQNGGMKTPIAVKPEPMEQDTAPVSSASSLDDIQTAQTNSVGSSRQMSLASTGSVRSPVQTIRPGENWQPRYNSLSFGWTILNGNQIKDTIFSGLPDIFEKIEGLEIEVSLDSLLTADQETKIKCVRGAIKIQNFEIIFAIHRMDPSILKTPENLDLLISIAPSTMDSQKVRDWMEAHPNAQYNEEEQLIIALAQVKNLEERLSIMRHMAHFELDLSTISGQLTSLSSATKALSTSVAFKNLVQLVLASQNIIYSASTHPIRGFIVSQLEDICQYKLSSGQTLLSVMAGVVKERPSEMSALFELIPILESAEKTPFASILSCICRLEEENTRADLEIKESFNDVVASFLETSQSKLSSVNETALSVKDELLGMMSYLAEPLPRADDVFTPETIFRRLASFLAALRHAVDTL